MGVVEQFFFLNYFSIIIILIGMYSHHLFEATAAFRESNVRLLIYDITSMSYIWLSSYWIKHRFPSSIIVKLFFLVIMDSTCVEDVMIHSQTVTTRPQESSNLYQSNKTNTDLCGRCCFNLMHKTTFRYVKASKCFTWRSVCASY